MNKTKLYLKGLAFIGMLCLITDVSAKGKFKDSQEVWQEFNLYHTFNKQWSVNLLLNNMTDVQEGNVDRFIQPGVKFKFTPGLFAEVMYRKEYFKSGADWKVEDRPMIRVGGSLKLGQWKIRNRHRMEFRFIEDQSTKYRYRTDVKVSPQWNFTKWHLSPYVQEELFVQEQEMTKIRSYLGLQGSVKRWEPSIYALVQSYNKPEGYLHGLVFGVCVSYRL